MERFMPLYDERAELAVRDLVARSIDDQLKKRHEKYALLDISCKPKEEISLPFSQYCFYVSPVCFGHNSSSNPGCSSCHYMCGGVQAGLQGETNVKGLYVAGEIACRGLHGANRLASNSLLEALVFARRAVQPSVDHMKGSSLDPTASNSWPRSVVPLSLVSNVTGKFMLMTKELRTELQPVMWDYVGIVPSTMRLETAEQRIGSLEAKWEECLVQNGWKPTMVGPESEMRNLFCCSKLVVSSAKKREPRTTLHRQFSSSRGE